MLITTLVVSFFKDGKGCDNVKLWFLVVCVRCEVLCRFVVLDNFALKVARPSLQNETTNVVINMKHVEPIRSKIK